MAEDKHAHFLTRFSTQKRGFSYYLLGSLIVIICSFIGQFPMFFFLPSQLPTSSNPMDMFAHLDSNLTFLLLLIPSLTAFLGFLLVVYRLHDQTLVSVTTSRDAIDFKRMLFGFLFWGMISTLIVGIDIAMHPDDFQWNFKPLPFLIMALIACLFIPIQSGLEEWLFRGYLLQGFTTLTRSPLLSLLLTSIIFGSLHILSQVILGLELYCVIIFFQKMRNLILTYLSIYQILILEILQVRILSFCQILIMPTKPWMFKSQYVKNIK